MSEKTDFTEQERIPFFNVISVNETIYHHLRATHTDWLHTPIAGFDGIWLEAKRDDNIANEGANLCVEIYISLPKQNKVLSGHFANTNQLEKTKVAIGEILTGRYRNVPSERIIIPTAAQTRKFGCSSVYEMYKDFLLQVKELISQFNEDQASAYLLGQNPPYFAALQRKEEIMDPFEFTDEMKNAHASAALITEDLQSIGIKKSHIIDRRLDLTENGTTNSLYIGNQQTLFYCVNVSPLAHK